MKIGAGLAPARIVSTGESRQAHPAPIPLRNLRTSKITYVLGTLLALSSTVHAQWAKLFQFPKMVHIIYFKDGSSKPNDGFIGLDANPSTIVSNSLWRTQDGGHTWQSLAGTSSIVPWSIVFRNNTQGWFCDYSRSMYATLDGGTTWNKVVDNVDVYGLGYAASTNRLVCAGSPCMYSADGLTFTPFSFSVYDFYVGVAFSDDTHGIVTPLKVSGTGGPVKLPTLLTSDGGLSWTKSDEYGEQCQPVGIDSSVVFFTASELDATDLGLAGRVRYSSNGGSSWSTRFQYHNHANFFGLTGTIRSGSGRLVIQTVTDTSEGIMVSEDSGETFYSICGPPAQSDTRFFVRDSFIYAGDSYGGLWLNSTGIGSNSTPQISSLKLDLPTQLGCASRDTAVTFTYFDSCNNIQAKLVSATIEGSPNFSLAAPSNAVRTIHPDDSIVVHYDPKIGLRDTARVHLRFHLGFVDSDTTITLTGQGIAPPENVRLLASFTASSVSAGQTTDLVITPDKAIAGRGLSKIAFDLLYNGDLLQKSAEATSVAGATITTSPLTLLLGKERGIHVVVSGNDMSLDPAQAIAKISYRTFVTDTTSTPVTISNLQLNNGDQNYSNCVLSADTSATSFTLALRCGDSILSSFLRTKGLRIVSIRPNPSSGAVTLSLRVAADDLAEIELVNALGVVERSTSHPLAAGANDIELATDGLPNGVYYVRVRSGGSVVGASVVIER